MEKYQKSQKDKWQLATFLPYYIVLLAGVLALAGVVYYVLGGLRTKYQAAGESINSLPEAGPIGGP